MCKLLQWQRFVGFEWTSPPFSGVKINTKDYIDTYHGGIYLAIRKAAITFCWHCNNCTRMYSKGQCLGHHNISSCRYTVALTLKINETKPCGNVFSFEIDFHWNGIMYHDCHVLYQIYKPKNRNLQDSPEFTAIVQGTGRPSYWCIVAKH